MPIAPKVRVLSIGSSCINRFQFDFFIERHPETKPSFPRGLFDWNISSLTSSLNVLRKLRDGMLMDALSDANGFRSAYDALIFHDALPGLSFFHETAPNELLADKGRTSQFLGKLAHLAQPFINTPDDTRTHLVWSNIQPNLPDTVENVIPWPDFILTFDRYREAKALGSALFGPSCTFSFVAAPDDAEAALTEQEDVHLTDLGRGPAYEGPRGLYEDILQNALA